MTFDDFISLEARQVLNENIFGSIARAAVRTAKDKVDSTMAKVGDHKAVGRMETRDAAHGLMNQFHRYLGRQGAKSVLKDDLVFFLKNLGYNIDDAACMKFIYGNDKGGDFSGSDHVADILDQVHDLVEKRQPLPADLVSQLRVAAGSDSSMAMTRFGLFKIMREFPSAAKSIAPVRNIAGWGPIKSQDAMKLFTKMARMKTMADDQRNGKIRQGEEVKDRSSDTLELPAWEMVKKGAIFAQLADRHKISFNQMMSFAGRTKQENEDFLTRLPEREMLDLAITLLQFYCAKQDSTSAILKMIGDRPAMHAALVEIGGAMQQEKGFNRGKCRARLAKALNEGDPRKSLADKAAFVGFLLEHLPSKFCFFKWAKDRFKEERPANNNENIPA